MVQPRLIFRVVILLLAPLCIPTLVFAAATSVTKNQDLQFGKFAGGSGLSGTVTIDTTGTRTRSGGVILLNSSFSPAQFTITGNAGKAYTLTLPSTFTIISGTSQMTVSAVTSSIPVSGSIPASGALAFTVGGTLTVDTTQKNSTYSGSLLVSVK